MVKLNGKSVVASAFTTSATILAFAFSSSKTPVTIVGMVCATVILLAAFAHEVLLANQKQRTLQATASEVLAAQASNG